MSDLNQGNNHPSQGTEASDSFLLGQSLAGDECAFEALVSRYRTPLLNYIRRVLKEDEQAQDVLQFVLLQLYVSQPRLLRDMPLRAWLFQVAHHRCVDELRKQRRGLAIHFSELSREDENEGIALIESIRDPRPLPEEIVEQIDMVAVLQQAIGRLPPTFRSVVHLRYCGQLTFDEIGRTLKLPASTVKSYFYRALPRLRSAIANSS
ncbi:MAG: RNA polymerase sigma factor [Ktedonobacteraceae bacterium]